MPACLQHLNLNCLLCANYSFPLAISIIIITEKPTCSTKVNHSSTTSSYSLLIWHFLLCILLVLAFGLGFLFIRKYNCGSVLVALGLISCYTYKYSILKTQKSYRDPNIYIIITFKQLERFAPFQHQILTECWFIHAYSLVVDYNI